MNKQAFLIIAHNQFDVLKMLVKQIDYYGNDIFIHVDRRVDDFDEKSIEKIVKESRIFFVKPRLKISWGTYDIVQCELMLLKKAISTQEYSYIHLLSGTDMLLCSGKHVYDFFEHQNQTQFVQFEKLTLGEEYKVKVRKYHFFIKKNPTFFYKFLHKVLIFAQFSIDRCKESGIEYQKGANWFSITGGFAKYLIENERTIYRLFSKTLNGDEMFVQTMLLNSPFAQDIVSNNFRNNYENILYCIDWNRGAPYEFMKEDYNMLINSGMLFARKFNWNKDKEIIMKLMEKSNE